MRNPGRVLLLLSQVQANGGVQRFNRTLLAACDRLGLDYDALSLADRVDCASSQARLRGFEGNKVRFSRAVAKALWSGHYRTVVIGHIHLLGLAAALTVLNPFSSTRLVLIVHGTEVWRGLTAAQRFSLLLVERTLCVSSYTRRCLSEQARRLDPSRLLIFPNALNEEWVNRQQEMARQAASDPLQLPARFILSVGRLTRHDRTKGIVTVIEALASLPADLHHVIAGGGDDAEFLRETAQRCGVAERVHLVGAVTDQQLARLYRDCLAFVLPSSQEGFGIVFIEAMFFGSIVIAAREKGTVDVVRHEETGLLVDYADPSGVASAVLRVLGDERLRQKLRLNATATVTEHGDYTFAAFTARISAVLNR